MTQCLAQVVGIGAVEMTGASCNLRPGLLYRGRDMTTVQKERRRERERGGGGNAREVKGRGVNILKRWNPLEGVLFGRKLGRVTTQTEGLSQAAGAGSMSSPCLPPVCSQGSLFLFMLL